MRYCKNTGLTILRVVVGALFMYHGITKFSATPEMIGFLGGAFHNIGLTFLSQEVWTTVLATVETLAGFLLIIGFLTRTAATAVIVIMLGAMYTKGWGRPSIELDALFLGTALALIFAGPGRFSCDMRCCEENCDVVTPTTTKTNNKYKGKEVVEA